MSPGASSPLEDQLLLIVTCAIPGQAPPPAGYPPHFKNKEHPLFDVRMMGLVAPPTSAALGEQNMVAPCGHPAAVMSPGAEVPGMPPTAQVPADGEGCMLACKTCFSCSFSASIWLER